MSSFHGSQGLLSNGLGDYSGYKLVAAAIVFIVLDVTCVALRFLARHFCRARTGLDDYLAILSLLSSVAVCTVGICESSLHRSFLQTFVLPFTVTDLDYEPVNVALGGVGHHAAAFKADSPIHVQYAKLTVTFIYLYFIAVTVPKISILSLYLRIFPQKPYRIACYALAGVLMGCLLGNVIATSLICVRVKALWDTSTGEGHCFHQNAYFRYSTLPNILTDIYMLILPLPVIWRMSLSKRDKIGLTITFGTGSV